MTDTKGPPKQDVALLCGPTEDLKGTRIVRARDGALEAGEVRPAQHGQALMGRELIRLKPRPDKPALCDVEVVQPAETHEAGTEERGYGPAQVATDAYRRNWERIFGLDDPDVDKRTDSSPRLLN